jgi:hypothetical protein
MATRLGACLFPAPGPRGYPRPRRSRREAHAEALLLPPASRPCTKERKHASVQAQLHVVSQNRLCFCLPDPEGTPGPGLKHYR